MTKKQNDHEPSEKSMDIINNVAGNMCLVSVFCDIDTEPYLAVVPIENAYETVAGIARHHMGEETFMQIIDEGDISEDDTIRYSLGMDAGKFMDLKSYNGGIFHDATSEDVTISITEFEPGAYIGGWSGKIIR